MRTPKVVKITLWIEEDLATEPEPRPYADNFPDSQIAHGISRTANLQGLMDWSEVEVEEVPANDPHGPGTHARNTFQENDSPSTPIGYRHINR